MLMAGVWGLVAGSALVLGALVGLHFRVSQRAVAAVMAFGGGVLISALSFDLMDEAFARGGFDSTGVGFVAGGVIFTGANWWLARRGARHRKRSGHIQAQPSEAEHEGSGMAIAVGAAQVREAVVVHHIVDGVGRPGLVRDVDELTQSGLGAV